MARHLSSRPKPTVFSYLVRSADERSHEVAAAADMLAVVRDITDAGVCYAEGDEEHERQALARARADLNAASQDIAIAVVEHMVR
jgi:hypothetical protein